MKIGRFNFSFGFGSASRNPQRDEPPRNLEAQLIAKADLADQELGEDLTSLSDEKLLAKLSR